MEAGVVRSGRTVLAILTAGALVASMLMLMGGTASAGHIPSTGELPDNCVEFQAGNTGTKNPEDFPGVGITLDSWQDTPGDPHTVNFTITGLGSNQYVDISVKSGTNVQEAGPFGNGSHTFANGLQNAISHIRLCVFEEDPTTTTTEPTTTTTVGETTTTVEDTTTTTVEDTTTTTVEETTTTTVEDTTTTVEVLDTTLTTAASTTSSIEDEVLAEELPFTGVESETLVFLATALGILGALVVYSARHVED